MRKHDLEEIVEIIAGGLFYIAIAAFIVTCTIMMVQDTKATIKVKERIAENGIEINTTMLGDE